METGEQVFLWWVLSPSSSVKKWKACKSKTPDSRHTAEAEQGTGLTPPEPAVRGRHRRPLEIWMAWYPREGRYFPIFDRHHEHISLGPVCLLWRRKVWFGIFISYGSVDTVLSQTFLFNFDQQDLNSSKQVCGPAVPQPIPLTATWSLTSMET
jgi:hypothetical protein